MEFAASKRQHYVARIVQKSSTAHPSPRKLRRAVQPEARTPGVENLDRRLHANEDTNEKTSDLENRRVIEVVFLAATRGVVFSERIHEDELQQLLEDRCKASNSFLSAASWDRAAAVSQHDAAQPRGN